MHFRLIVNDIMTELNNSEQILLKIIVPDFQLAEQT